MPGLVRHGTGRRVLHRRRSPAWSAAAWPRERSRRTQPRRRDRFKSHPRPTSHRRTRTSGDCGSGSGQAITGHASRPSSGGSFAATRVSCERSIDSARPLRPRPPSDGERDPASKNEADPQGPRLDVRERTERSAGRRQPGHGHAPEGSDVATSAACADVVGPGPLAWTDDGRPPEMTGCIDRDVHRAQSRAVVVAGERAEIRMIVAGPQSVTWPLSNTSPDSVTVPPVGTVLGDTTSEAAPAGADQSEATAAPSAISITTRRRLTVTSPRRARHYAGLSRLATADGPQRPHRRSGAVLVSGAPVRHHAVPAGSSRWMPWSWPRSKQCWRARGALGGWWS